MATNSDGSIVLSVKIDDSNIKPQLSKLKSEIEYMAKRTDKVAASFSKINTELIKSELQNEKLKQAQEKTAQSVEKTYQAIEKTNQAKLKTSQLDDKAILSAEKVAQAELKTAQQQEKLNVEKAKAAQQSAKQAQEEVKVYNEVFKASSAREKANQEAEKTFQAVEKTKQAEESTRQAFEKTAQSQQKTTQETEKTKQAQEKTKQAVEKTKQAQNKTTEAINKSKKATNTWKTAIKNTTITIREMAKALGVVFGIRELLRFSNEASKLASQTESYILRIGQIYGEAGKQVSDFIDANSQALGMSKTAAYEAASSYGNLFSSFADGAENAKLTNDMLQTTAVIASKTGRTFDEVFTKIQSGIFGNTRAIDDLGVYVNQATITTTKAFQTISDGRPWAQLTGNEQKQILTLAILEQSQAKYGNTVLQSTALTRSQFNAAFQDFKTTWGQVINIVLMPVLKVLTVVFNYATMALKAVLAFFGKEVTVTGGAMSDISAGSAGIADNIDNATNSQKGLTKSVKDTNKEVKKTIAGFDELQILSDNTKVESGTDSGTGAGAGATAGSPVGGNSNIEITDSQVQAVSTYSEKFEELRLALIGVKDIDLTNLTNSLKGLKDPLSDLADLGWEILLWGIKNVIVPLTEFTIEEVLPRFFDTLTTSLRLFVKILDEHFETVKQFYNDFLKPIASYAADGFLKLWDTLNENLDEFVTIVENSTAWQDLRTILGLIYAVLEPVVKWIIDFVVWVGKLSINAAWTELKWLFLDIEDALGLVADIINGDFSGAWEHLKDLMWDNKINKAKENLDNLKKSFDDVKTKVEEFIKDWKSKIDDMVESWKTKISAWWTDNVEPWFKKEKWEELFFKIGESLANAIVGVGGFVEKWKTNITNWWNDNVSPWFTKEKWESLFLNIVTGIVNFFIGEDGFINTWKTKISNWWTNDVSPWFTVEKWQELGTKIKDGILKGVNGVVNGMKSVFNGIIDGFQSLVNGGIDMINSLIKGWNKVADVTPGLKSINTIGKVNLSKYKLNITPLAQGAVLPANKPFLAMVGDQKNGTNIEAPAELIKKMAMEAIIETNASNQGQTVREEHYYLDQTELMSILYKLVKGGERLKGNSLLN